MARKQAELAPYIEAAMQRKQWMRPLASEAVPPVPAYGRSVVATDGNAERDRSPTRRGYQHPGPRTRQRGCTLPGTIRVFGRAVWHEAALGLIRQHRVREKQMPVSLVEKSARYGALHAGDAFVAGGCWDVGSARLMAHAGMPCLETSSAGRDVCPRAA